MRKKFKSNKKSNYSKKSSDHDRNLDLQKGDGIDESPGRNDPAWYANDLSLLRDAASLPFSQSLGVKIRAYDREFYVPGFMAFRIAPTVGYAKDINSPINLAANSMYTFVRHLNSGGKNYEATDLMKYVYSMSEVYMYINFIMRVYGSVQLLAQRNRYLGRAIVGAQGFKYDAIAADLARFRYAINLLINKASTFAVPANLTLFARHNMLFQNIYTEGPSIKDQLYFYTPDGFHIYNDTTGNMEYRVWGGYSTDGYGRYTVDDLIQWGNDMLDPLITSEDMNIMSGDILKAYGSGGLMKLTSIGPDYMILPVTNFNVLEQMKNATPCPVIPSSLNIVEERNAELAISWLSSKPRINVSSSTDGSIVPDENIPTWYSSQHIYGKDQLLLTGIVDPGPDIVMENTRLKVTNAFDSIAGMGIECGSELCTRVTIYKMVDGYPSNAMRLISIEDSALAYVNINYDEPNQVYTLNDTGGADFTLAWLNVASSFQYTPVLPVVPLIRWNVNGPVVQWNSALYDVTGFTGDIDNYTVIDAQTLSNIHHTALMSELAVPIIGKF